MRRRSGILLFLAVWALLAAPAVCSGGLAGHGCEPGHESDCPADPCNTLAVGGPAGAKAVGKSDLVATVTTPSVAATVPADSPAAAPPAAVLRLPIPAAALPLRC